MIAKLTIAATASFLLGACATPQTLADNLDSAERDEPDVIVQLR